MGILTPPVACSIFTQDSLLILLREIGISEVTAILVDVMHTNARPPTPNARVPTPNALACRPTPTSSVIRGVEPLQRVFWLVEAL